MNHGEMVNDSAVGHAVVRRSKLEKIVKSCLAHFANISQHKSLTTN